MRNSAGRRGRTGRTTLAGAIVTIALAAGCTSVAEEAGEVDTAREVREATVSTLPNGDVNPIAAGEQLTDDDTVALPPGFPEDIPRPQGGVLDASSAPNRLDGTPIEDAGPSDADWVFYAIPSGDMFATVDVYLRQLQMAGISVKARNDTDGEIELELERPRPTKVRVSQFDGGVSFVVLVQRS